MNRLLLVLCLVLASCATAGNGRVHTLQPTEASQLLAAGKTTRAEAEQLLGAGNTLRFDSGWSTLTYVYRDTLPRFLDFVPVVGLVTSAMDHAETELVLLFDEGGVLRKCKLRRVT